MNSQNGEVKEVCDMFCAMQKTLIQGSADAERCAATRCIYATLRYCAARRCRPPKALSARPHIAASALVHHFLTGATVCWSRRRGEPYIGPGYETITDLLNAGLTDEELAPFALKPKAKQMVMAQIAAGAGGARTEIVD